MCKSCWGQRCQRGKETGPLWRSSSSLAFPSCTRFWTGPRRQGFASPRNNSAPLTAAGRSKKPPLSKRERLKTERDQSAANLDLFFTATDSNPSSTILNRITLLTAHHVSVDSQRDSCVTVA